MKKLSTLRTMLAALLVAVGMGTAWADELPTPVYFNDFSSTDGLTIVGNGVFEDDADARFGKVFHNDPTLTKAIRTNYLLLPNDVLSHSATSKEMTIGFWVNMKDAKDFFFSPLLSAYGMSPADNATAGKEGNNENWPMFVAEARGLLQLNNDGWCDFGINANPVGSDFNDGTPYVTTVWLDDVKWHYYTLVLTSTTAKVYVDGELKNGWTVDGTSDGQKIDGFFTYGANYKYICLGGNQAWNWGDPDPAFAFDDFAVYNKVLTADQIKQVMEAKIAIPADATFDFANNPQSWPVTTVVYGDEFDNAAVSTLTSNDVVLTSVQKAYYANVVYKNGDAAPAFRVFKGNDFKLTAPEEKAIVKVDFTMVEGQNCDFSADNGNMGESGWTGNASVVTFSSAATRLIAKIDVTLADENSETFKPSFDVEAANIAAFNAIEDGKKVKLTLTNAKVNGNYNGYYVEDATGATVIKGIELTAGTALNGYIVGEKKTNSSIDYMNDPAVAVEYQLTASDASTFEATATTLTGTVMTGADACAQANYGRLITLENVAISGSGQNKTLTVDGVALAIKARDYMGVLPAEYTWPEKASKITGVVIYYMTGWFLMPISAEAIVAADTQPTVATFDFSNGSLMTPGTKLTDTAGFIFNKTFAVDNVALQVTAGSAQSAVYKDANRGTCLAMFPMYAMMGITAPEGYAVTKIEFTQAGTGDLNMTPTVGTVEDHTWTGNADVVYFTMPQSQGTAYLSKVTVTLAAKTSETVTATIDYVECDNIAAFNALETGTPAKVTLTDAEVTGISANGYGTAWIQDATGGCLIQYSSLIEGLQEKTKLNGVVYVILRKNSGNTQMKDAIDTPKSSLTAESISDYTMVEGTLEEVNVAANLNKVVKITGASFVATNTTDGTLTQNGATIAVKNGSATANQQLHKITDTWVKDETKMENVTIVAILTAQSATVNQLLPISMIAVPTGINSINATTTESMTIYNLQGQRLNGLQKGINIVNGKKVVIK